MKVLVVGGGAREHALGWKIRQSPLITKLYFAPGNAGTASLGENLKLPPENFSGLASWASSNQIALTVVGPEAPLLLGIVEEFAGKNLLILGPGRAGALLEGSKIWAKNFLRKYQIPTASSQEFHSFAEARESLLSRPFPVVIKADGLAQGKGVVVCQEPEEAEKVLSAFLVEKTLGEAGERVLIESFLEGEELSVFALCDGEKFCYLGEARDYKRALDGERGPNTGGMGAVSSPALIGESLRNEILTKIFKPALAGLSQEKIVYRGILYAGLMLTKQGPKVLEFNVRFGDPETQVILPRLREDLLSLLDRAARGNVGKERAALSDETTIGVVVAAEGYPGNYKKGVPLPDCNSLSGSGDILLFHASTALENGKTVNQGGRALTVVSSDFSPEKAKEKVYQALQSAMWSGYFYRKDIGASLISHSGVSVGSGSRQHF